MKVVQKAVGIPDPTGIIAGITVLRLQLWLKCRGYLLRDALCGVLDGPTNGEMLCQPMGYGKPTPRNGVSVPRTFLALLVCLALVAAVAAMGYICCRSVADLGDAKDTTAWLVGISNRQREEDTTPKQTHDSLGINHTYDGTEDVRWYVFVGPDYGTQYLFNDHS